MEYNKKQVIEIPLFPDSTIKLFAELNEKLPLGSILLDKDLTKRLSYDYIHGSVFLEGNTYTPGGISTLLDRNITESGTTMEEANMILNIKESVDFLFLTKKEDLDKRLLKDFHSLLSKNLVERKYEGAMRNKPVFITSSDYIPLSVPSTIEEELDTILSIAQSIECPFTKAVYLQLNLSYLQPFIDVNKRTARTTNFHVLLHNGLVPLYMSKSSAESGFIDAVLAYYDFGDSTKFVEWFTTSYLAMYRKLLGREIAL